MQSAATFLMALGLAAATAAADEARSDGALVADCTREISERFLDATTEHAEVARQEIVRSATEDRVRLTLATGEGRTATATCKFRGGKLFDVVR